MLCCVVLCYVTRRLFIINYSPIERDVGHLLARVKERVFGALGENVLLCVQGKGRDTIKTPSMC